MVELFPSKVSGFFIFNRAILPCSGPAGRSCHARSTPSATSCIRSCVVTIGTGFLGGEGKRRCLEGGRGSSDGGPEGGPADDPGGVDGGFPPCPVPGSGAGTLGDMWRLSCSSRCLISGVVGTAGGLCRRGLGNGFKRCGLPNAGGEWADGALVLVCQMGLLQAGGPAGTSSIASNEILVARC